MRHPRRCRARRAAEQGAELVDAGAEPASAGDCPAGEHEEARRPAPARDPSAPTKAQWDEHQATHLPFRIWCPHCVAGRLDNPPHRRVPAHESTVPEVHMDYAFCRRAEDERTVPLLVMKHRQSRAVRCWVVPAKGALDAVAAEIADHGLRGFGVQGEVILKTDNEDAINGLRHKVQALHPGAALEQLPAAHEHESNGVIETATSWATGC